MTWLQRRGITSKRVRFRGVGPIPETVDGYDWAPFVSIRRLWYWRGRVIWKRELARRYLDQYTIIKWAFPS